MNWTKKTFGVLIGFFVLANLTSSFNYGQVRENLLVIQKTELLEPKVGLGNNGIAFEIAQKQLPCNFTTGYIIISKEKVRTIKCKGNSRIAFKIQNDDRLKYKSTLLKAVLNDIIEQKSHWI